MCWQAVEDILCSELDCNTVIACKQLVPKSQERCETVKRAAKNATQPPKHAHPTTYDIPRSHQPVYAQPRDWCRDITSFQRPARKARRGMCPACRWKPVAEQNELYAELGEAMAESREAQRERDVWRHLGRVAGCSSPAGGLSIRTVAPPTSDQAALVSGAGMGWQGGSAPGAPGTGHYPEVGAIGYPQELDFCVDETTAQGWDHYDGGFSRGHRQGHGDEWGPERRR